MPSNRTTMTDFRRLYPLWRSVWKIPMGTSQKVKKGRRKVLDLGRNNPRQWYTLGAIWLESKFVRKDVWESWWTTNLTWARNKPVKEAGHILRFISKSTANNPRKVILTLYSALVKTHLEYCAQFWLPSAGTQISWNKSSTRPQTWWMAWTPLIWGKTEKAGIF